MEEIWKPLQGYERYQISSYGKIMRNDRVLKTNIRYNKNGSPKCVRFGFKMNDVVKSLSVHRLVAFAFLSEKPEGNYTVDHIDRNPLNNHVSNLRWATPSEQAKNRKNSRVNNIKFTEAQLDEMYLLSKRMSLTEISKIYGVNRTAIYNVLRYIQKDY